MKEDIRETTLKDINKLLSDFVTSKMHENELHFFPGKVVDNNDPDKLGRCRIRIYGLFSDDIPDNDLPWASPDFNFIGSTLGSFVVPPVDAIVKVYLEKGDYYRPMYTTKVIEKSKLSEMTEKDEDYPNSMVFFQTDLGDFFKVNRTTGTSTYHHASGLLITIDKDGNMEIDNNSSPSAGTLTITCKGDIALKSETGDVKIEAPLGKIKLGGDDATQPVNQLPNCLYSGAPHSIGQNFPGLPGGTYVRP